MILSINSLKNLMLINSILLMISLFQYSFISYLNNLFGIFCTLMFRNYVLIHFIEYGTRNIAKISDKLPIENYKYEFHKNVATSTLVETGTHIFIHKNIITITAINLSGGEIWFDLLYFIPTTFLFELIFDFFHYSAHRLLHHKYLYKYLHKKHHKFPHPSAITTYYQEPLDLIISNSVPMVASLLLFPYISYFQYNLIIVYKEFIEISGHSGKKCTTSSFPQFIWLPKLFHIELFTEEHDLHHSLNNCNYSKRFSLWDKVFNTYRPSQSLLK